MKTKELFDLDEEEWMLFKFKQKPVPQGQIKAHWLKILNEINEQDQLGDASQTLNWLKILNEINEQDTKSREERSK